MTKNYLLRLRCPYGDGDERVILHDGEETLEQVLSSRWDFECPIHGVQREMPVQATEITASLVPRRRWPQPPRPGIPKAGQRRSKRLPLRVAVFVSGRGRDQSAFREETTTLLVNANGALIPIAAKVRLGETVLLVNKSTREEQECRVAYVGPQGGGKMKVGVAFKGLAPDFWRVDFPSPD